jgi:hypothetical protein
MLQGDAQTSAEHEAMIEVEEAERALELAQLRLVTVANQRTQGRRGRLRLVPAIKPERSLEAR